MNAEKINTVTNRHTISTAQFCSFQFNTIKKLLLRGAIVFIASLFFILPNNIGKAQIQFPTFFSERGDTIKYTYSLPDSLYKRNELIIKFKQQTLDLNLLCYEYPVAPKAQILNNIDGIPSWFKTQLMSQRFSVKDVINDTNLVNSLLSFGGDSIRRMTSANPCRDTLSISRLGDTLICEDYLWFILEINNDTSAIYGSVLINYLYNHLIFGADLNYAIKFNAAPNDGYFNLQYSLTDLFGIGCESAWETEKGDYKIKIGIIDYGADWEHCDFGGNIGPNYKISGGWNYWADPPNDELINGSGDHGTPIAGIIGALTNRNCGASSNSVAGITGGWYSPPIDNKGCQLIILKVNQDLTPELDPNGEVGYIGPVISAILEASSHVDYQPGYGAAVDILNMSFELHNGNNVFDVSCEPFRSALIYAFENNVSLVTGRGNYGVNRVTNPACYEPSMITSVGGSFWDRRYYGSSNYGRQMDILAPWGGSANETPLVPPRSINIYTTGNSNTFTNFRGTSASAPHVSGVYGLLRSYALNHNLINTTIPLYSYFEPEDYEGMIKASAFDIPESKDPLYYRDKYDNYSGWGHLQADKLFEMLNNGYSVEHFTSDQKLTPSDWSPQMNFLFENSGKVENKPIKSVWRESGHVIRIWKITGL